MSLHDEVEILLVEDHPTAPELTIEALREGNFASHTAWVNKAQALECVFCRGAYADRSVGAPPRMILLDQRLPRVDGLEVLRALKTNDRTRSIPVLTSSQDEPDVKESYRLGVNNFVHKPVEFAAFAKVVARLGLYWRLANWSPA